MILSGAQLMYRHANMTMLPMYRIGKILPIYISNISSKCYALDLYGVFRNPSCYFISDWLMQNVLSCF